MPRYVAGAPLVDHANTPPERPPLTYARRKIDLTFTLGEGRFGATGQSTLSLKGLRVQAKLTMQQLPTPGGIAQLRIYGMSLDHVNQLSKPAISGASETTASRSPLVTTKPG
jgi:hypothetical protein